MKNEDLIELLRSTIESDAIISTLYAVFHLNRGYSLELLDKIIQYGVDEGILIIGNINDYDKRYNKIDWSQDNSIQEVFMPNSQNYIKVLFSCEPSIPKEFKQFVIE